MEIVIHKIKTMKGNETDCVALIVIKVSDPNN